MNLEKLAELRAYIKDNRLEGVEVRSNGAIRIRFYLDGTQRNETLKGIEATRSNLKVAARKRATVQHEINLGIFDYAAHFPRSAVALAKKRAPQSDMFGPALDKWLALKEASKAPETFRSYQTKANLHVRPRWGSYALSEIKKSDVEHWINAELWNHKQNQPYSNKTLNEIMIIMRGVLGDAYLDEVITKNPMSYIGFLETGKGDPDPFTQAEMLALFTVETERKVEQLGFELACWTGVSVSELLGLATSDVDLERNVLHVRRANVNGAYKVPKEASRAREIELLKPARWVLKRLVSLSVGVAPTQISVLQRDNRSRVDEELVFLIRNSRSNGPIASDLSFRERFFHTLCKKAKVRYRGPNQARHTFASQLLSKYVDKAWIAKQMGHTTTAMLDAHYGTYIPEDTHQLALQISEKLGFSVPARPSQDQKIGDNLKNRYES
mgnify:CR=1 FL=1